MPYHCIHHPIATELEHAALQVFPQMKALQADLAATQAQLAQLQTALDGADAPQTRLGFDEDEFGMKVRIVRCHVAARQKLFNDAFASSAWGALSGDSVVLSDVLKLLRAAYFSGKTFMFPDNNWLVDVRCLCLQMAEMEGEKAALLTELSAAQGRESLVAMGQDSGPEEEAMSRSQSHQESTTTAPTVRTSSPARTAVRICSHILGPGKF